MRRIWKLILLTAALALLLPGCMLKTIDEMYALPRRSEEYQDLQTAIDGVMGGLEYCAPIQGENQQTVQLADLNGDGQLEAVLFAKGSGERPLKIFVFSQRNGTYEQIAAMETTGTAFEQVEYAEIDEAPGVELVVGRQVGNEVLHSLSAYSFASGQADTILTAGYTRFLTAELDQDSLRELVVLRPGAEAGNGVAELYDFQNGAMERATEVPMSVPVENIKRIAAGGMYAATNAVFVASTYGEDSIITDVFTVVNGRFVNVSFSNESGTSMKTIRNYYVYGDDIDSDGLIEIPALVYPDEETPSRQDLLRWYNLTTTGDEVDKAFTYHNYLEHWYVTLESRWMDTLHVTRGEDVGQTAGYVFSCGSKGDVLFVIYAFTGDERMTLATSEGRFVLSQTEEVVYAGCLGPESRTFGLDQETLTSYFNFIQEDWKTGET